MSQSKGKHSRPRNRLHDHPLLTKGGVHQKSHKALRKQAKQTLHKRSWSDLNVFNQCI